ncbi:MAG: lysine--tRNA ligase [Candidatus Aenigmatarchaeota archaeon]|nr:lysine--tRNA ligase [Candidatus Aenigmarchaeota archaeon]
MKSEESGLKDIMEKRKKALEEMEKLGVYPFKTNKYEKTYRISQIHMRFSKIQPGEKLEYENVKIAGRIRSIRIHGKSCFIDLEDFDGRIQIFLEVKTLGEKKYKIVKLLDTGDFIGVEGFVFKTMKGELSVWSKDFEVLAKALRPLPSEWFGLKDTEVRYRQRYVDLLMNPKVKETFLTRTKVIELLREKMKSLGFIEVETPVLQPIAGGANARPFITYHNALGINLYLRIATELYLKRLIVGGFEKIFEIGPDFRNEGVDTKHNPEFTMMEFYWAYANYEDNMKLTEELYTSIVKEIKGGYKIKYQGKEIDFTPPWKKLTMEQAIKEFAGIDVEGKNEDQLKKIARVKNIEIPDQATRGEIIGILFEELAESKIINPTFIIDHPVELCPLAKKKKAEPKLIERFEVFVAGKELINAYSEINDPIDQKKRFEEQVAKRAKGDEEAHPFDKDFIRALEYGMPPTTGHGIGIDRFVMLLTDSPSIRDVIFFPTLKPEQEIILYGDQVSNKATKKK